MSHKDRSRLKRDLVSPFPTLTKIFDRYEVGEADLEDFWLAFDSVVYYRRWAKLNSNKERKEVSIQYKQQGGKTSEEILSHMSERKRRLTQLAALEYYRMSFPSDGS